MVRANLARLAAAVQAGNVTEARALLEVSPELIAMDMSGGDEHRVLHYAVLRRDAAMVKMLMEAGADARKGIYPHRDATTAWTLAKDRGYGEIVAVIEEEEDRRRGRMSCPNATIAPLHDEISRAIRKGDNAAAIGLLESDGSLIHTCDREGGTPLHAAAEAGNDAMVEWLLARGANVRKQDARGFTALDRAAQAADPRNQQAAQFAGIAARLLERGAEVTVRGAVALGDRDRVRDLIRENPAVLREISTYGGGLLSLAVNHGQRQMVRLLLDLGADVDERVMLSELEEPTPSWGMPLWYAALAGNREMVKLLLDRGADPNANVYASGWPLRNGWGHKDPGAKNLLLERGAKPQPYMVAEAHDVAEAGQLLAADGSEELARELAWSAADHGCPEIVELTLPRLSWPATDPRWHWILIQPIRGGGHEGHMRSMAALLRHGIDPNVSRFGQTVLHFAAAWHGSVSGPDRARFAGMLLDYGARLDVRDDLLRSTPLGWACRWGRTELVELLMARGAPVEEPDAEAWATPAAWAEKMGRDDVLALLRLR